MPIGTQVLINTGVFYTALFNISSTPLRLAITESLPSIRGLGTPLIFTGKCGKMGQF